MKPVQNRLLGFTSITLFNTTIKTTINTGHTTIKAFTTIRIPIVVLVVNLFVLVVNLFSVRYRYLTEIGPTKCKHVIEAMVCTCFDVSPQLIDILR